MTGLPYLGRVAFGLRAPKARVEAVGKGVTQLQPGDEVFGTCDGSFAEHATARVDTIALKPAGSGHLHPLPATRLF